ncbi:hypothetical protein CI109_102194 [Kwoniella shandongensis]|uniref:Uncharacterized protein n=1 Tax=Kwoniella shandongensis TaxID=1734106 RepID=A0A5M6BYV0_9TREE|nr:uncharacterized protein CI109_003649 [Kwoniella shandongensis]KAA5527994.1 hypothetical protein CI109_003649 [Kwoniella shandongensis]
MPNGALTANPPNATQHITTHGSDWLWAVFAIMTFTDIVVFIWQFKLPRGQRVFHQLAMFILTTAAISYFSMASNLGSTPVSTEFAHMGYAAGTSRQFWYVRYIDWVVTTPALLLTLVLASGLPLSDIIALCYFDLVMIVTGLVGGLVPSTYKWGFYAFGCAALFYIWWVLAGPARKSAGVIGADFKTTFTRSAAILSFLWLLYPIAWGLADGANVISPDSEMIFYGILDVLAKPVYTVYHLATLSRLDLTLLQLSSGKFSTSAVHDREKYGNTAVNGTTPAAPVSGRRGMFGKRSQQPAEPRTSDITAVAP